MQLYTIRTSLMNPFTLLLLVTLGGLLWSCNSTRPLGIQKSVLPKYPIADDVQSLALLNRSLNTHFTDIPTDSLEKRFLSGKLLLDTCFRDSAACDTSLQVAAHALFESGRFDVVIPKEGNLRRIDTLDVLPALDVDFVVQTCKDFKVDALLVLESFKEDINTKYYQDVLNNLMYGNSYFATTDLVFHSVWRLYRPDLLKPAIRFETRDTINWANENYSLENLYKDMPKIKEALIGGGIASGLKISEFIAPSWRNDTRYYYLTKDPAIDAAIPMIKQNKWEEAKAIWNRNLDGVSASKKAKILYNLALTAEMEDRLDDAIEHLMTAYKTKYSRQIEWYLKKLDSLKAAKMKEPTNRY